jgi:hypothetical protein
MLAELVNDIFNLGLFGFVLDIFGLVVRSLINMPTPILSPSQGLRLFLESQTMSSLTKFLSKTLIYKIQN